MAERETELIAIDGTEALASVLIRPTPDGNGIVVEAWANGITKPDAAKVLRQVAAMWAEGD